MTALPKYVALLIEAHQRGALHPGTVAVAEVRHEDWCAIWKGKPCDCESDIELRYPEVKS